MKMQLFSQIQSTEKMSTAKKTNYLNSKFLFIIIIFSICITSVQSCGPGRGFGKPRRPRKLTPLVFKQHIPNVSENTLGASGLQENKITREDPRFKDLVPNYNKDIIFKDEEGTGADRLMSQRCKEKLNTLAVSVMNQWPGVRLRVTEGWDEEYHHAPDSLHYEGRAVDITTSDRDRSKLGMLARLAVEAGFDWVFYESRQHIHCSVKSDSSQVSHSSGCFTGASTVLTSTGERRKLKELRLGERVQSVDPAGHVVFSEVIMFLDRDLNKTLQFMSIETEGGAIINVTPSHLLMAWLPHANKIKYIYADKLEENNFLLVNINNNLEPRKILKIKTIISNGLFAPLTEHGTIVIDSIAASCYALVDSQSLAHNTFMPVRLITSLSKLFNFNNSYKNNQFRESKQNGIHWYAKTLYKIKDYVLPSNWIHH